ncbi:hypothetical protein DPEC_G00316630 [Dallia pectoralis]|uniref:Uncharacterized protein n=1 Tax=Dallia pectoralis TaxID=75939 RepID=A0ACC2FD20_DALPE|nr:hypothetical protein DPEC_G00316630 [Dallia pectoralis]
MGVSVTPTWDRRCCRSRVSPFYLYARLLQHATPAWKLRSEPESNRYRLERMGFWVFSVQKGMQPRSPWQPPERRRERLAGERAPVDGVTSRAWRRRVCARACAGSRHLGVLRPRAGANACVTCHSGISPGVARYDHSCEKNNKRKKR